MFASRAISCRTLTKLRYWWNCSRVVLSSQRCSVFILFGNYGVRYGQQDMTDVLSNGTSKNFNSRINRRLLGTNCDMTVSLCLQKAEHSFACLWFRRTRWQKATTLLSPSPQQHALYSRTCISIVTLDLSPSNPQTQTQSCRDRKWYECLRHISSNFMEKNFFFFFGILAKKVTTIQAIYV